MEVHIKFLGLFFVLLTWYGSAESVRPVTSFYRVPCESVCTNYYRVGNNKYNRDRKYTYTWCSVSSFPYWDYCSLDPATTSHGSTCRDDHPCGQYGYSYYWCYSNDLSWSYCSPEVQEDEPAVSINAYYCKNACADRGEDYFWCELNFGGSWWWDYCSPVLGFDFYGYKCSNDCRFRRFNYLWCNSIYYWQKWNYCGVPESVNGTSLTADLAKD